LFELQGVVGSRMIEEEGWRLEGFAWRFSLPRLLPVVRRPHIETLLILGLESTLRIRRDPKRLGRAHRVALADITNNLQRAHILNCLLKACALLGFGSATSLTHYLNDNIKNYYMSRKQLTIKLHQSSLMLMFSVHPSSL
jgi:hypothetical protein